MPAKLTISKKITVVVPTTYLQFTSTSNGYINTDMHLNGSGSIIITKAKLYFVALSITITKEGKYVPNTAQIQVYRNNNTILSFTQSYSESNETTFYTSAYLNLLVGDVITASISFDQPTREVTQPNKFDNLGNEDKKISEKSFCNDTTVVTVLANPNSTFINIV